MAAEDMVEAQPVTGPMIGQTCEVLLNNRWHEAEILKDNPHTIVVRVLTNGRTIKRHKEKHPIIWPHERREAHP
ncbi:MAG: hypothetical protein AB1491_00320 [Thermodesulfobacteriota bacterium]